MKVTEGLSTEHRVFLTQLNRLEASLADAALPAEAIRAMVKLIEEPLEEHAHLEEQFLFPALEPHLTRRAGPLAVMEAEHQELRRLLGHIAAAQLPLNPLTQQFIATLRAHIAKEDGILFPMAESFLGAGRLEELGTSYAVR